MSKSIKILLIVLAVLIVAGAIGTAYWLGQKRKKPESVVPETESFIPKGWTEEAKEKTEESQGQKGTEQSSQSEIKAEQFSYQTYITADQKFSFDYPQQWIKSEISDPSSVLPKNLIDKYNAKIPVIITYTSPTELIQLSLTYYEFKADQTPSQAMDQLIEEAKNQGMKTEILNKESAPKSYLIESKVEEQNLKLRAKEKLFFLEEKGEKQPAYILSISVLEKDWVKYASLVDHLLDSAKLK